MIQWLKTVFGWRKNRRRLWALADFLDTVPPVQFDIAVWDCGSTACAFGWAGRMPEFQAEGLVYVQGHCPQFEGCSGNTAAALFLGITLAQANYLFHPSTYKQHERRNPKVVAQRLREVAGPRPRQRRKFDRLSLLVPPAKRLLSTPIKENTDVPVMK